MDGALDTSAIVQWLQQYGGFCNCEVVFNVDTYWGQFGGRERVDADETD